MKSLRLRIAIVFVLVIFSSLVLSFYISKSIYEEQLTNEIKKDVQVAMLFIDEKKETTSIEKIVYDLSLLTMYHVNVLNDSSETEYFTETEIKTARSGILQINVTNPKRGAAVFSVKLDNTAYVIEFIMKSHTLSDLAWYAQKNITNLAMGIGLVLILLASSYIVKPIKALTLASKRVAEGDFTANFNTKRKDEIGQLTNSFRKMIVSVEGMIKARQEFISNVSHEYQTPITSIKGFAKALKEKKLSKEQQYKYLTIIENEAERLSMLSYNVLKLSHLQYDETKRLEFSTFSLADMLRDIIILLYPQASKKEIEWDVQLQSASIKADAMLMKQLWINLLGNAVHFSPVGGKIIVQLRQKQSGKVEVRIIDEGPGILNEQLPFIFETFYKSADSTGNGLGLTIVKEIVQKHNGAIKIINRNPTGLVIIVKLNKNL